MPQNDEDRFIIAQSDIGSHFNELPKHVLTRSDISSILDSNREFWRLTEKLSTSKFIEYLTKHGDLSETSLKFPGRNYPRYIWGNVSEYEIADSISNNAHFSHYSAVYLHGLTDQIPKVIYTRIELPHESKSNNSNMEQDNIDRVFSRKQRISQNIANLGKTKIYLLYGKKSNDLGVDYLDHNYGNNLRCTNIERTLIDITVRPSYAGGVSEILRAYTKAQPIVSINKLVSYLKKLDYSYPYHQAIGFYLEKTKVYTESQISLLRDLRISHDFYLDYKMGKTDYVKEWQLFIPHGF
jgi:predicted transcriptional regulator of viral defense system